MIVEDFHSRDDTWIDISVIKNDYMKVCSQQGAQRNTVHQGIDYFLAENNIDQKKSNGYLDIHVNQKQLWCFQ